MATETQITEERELERKRAELATFDSEYLRIVGRRYAALDDIKARIAAARAARRPIRQTDQDQDDQEAQEIREAQEEARVARETAAASRSSR